MGLRRYISRFRAVIHLEGDPYLVRFRLLVTQSLCGYLHHILRSDADRNLHDHPFDFVTIVLWGGYYEHTPAGRRWCPPGTVIRHSAEDLHRIEIPAGQTAWTLFLRGPRTRDWGFQTPDGWIDWRDYEEAGDMTGIRSAKQTYS